ncbi:MAG TPA: hypothetical protein PL001_04170 [Candidatus Kryptobacter bacterium]|nr:hypothetical protein [Candidatus Kryptobacter bacterium]
MNKLNVSGHWNEISGKHEEPFTNLTGNDLPFKEGEREIGFMKSTSNTSFVVGTAVLVVYFLLCGGEVSAGIVLLGWMLFTRKARGAQWVSSKLRILATPISRVRARRMSQRDLQHGPVRREYQTQRRLAR